MKFDQPLTDAQRALAEDFLPIARWTVHTYINSNEMVSGLSHEDLLQEAYLALCGAAATYREGGTQFKTYAVTVIRNHLLDYCRRIYRNNRTLPTLSLDAPAEEQDTANLSEALSDSITDFEDTCLSHVWAKEFLSQRKSAYTGCAKLGVEALELKVLGGYGVTDIAALYHAKPNLVGAWISKAKRKLREDMAEYPMPDVENNLSHS